MQPGRMPVVAAGTVHSSSPSSQTRVAVGASSAHPSAETHSTSSAPCAPAQRSEAMLTAYDRVLTPPSSHGAAGAGVRGVPQAAVATVTPSRRARSDGRR